MVQEKSNYCLCSIIADIFRGYNIKISQDEIACNLTPSKDKRGFKQDDNKIKEFMKNNGFDYNFYWWNQTPFNEPDSLLNEIANNDGFVGIEYHAYRVLEFEDPQITVLDPANASEAPKDFDYSYLMKKLHKVDGGFGLIKKLN